MVGHNLIVAGRSYAHGIESINRGNVRYFDSLMGAAYSHCHAANCALLINPPGYRSQNRLHIHFRLLNRPGADLKRKLESAVCGSGGWHSGEFLCQGKAKYFAGFPAVFSVAMGSGSIASSTVIAWPRSCGGRGTIIMVAPSCTLEHKIVVGR